MMVDDERPLTPTLSHSCVEATAAMLPLNSLPSPLRLLLPVTPTPVGVSSCAHSSTHQSSSTEHSLTRSACVRVCV